MGTKKPLLSVLSCSENHTTEGPLRDRGARGAPSIPNGLKCQTMIGMEDWEGGRFGKKNTDCGEEFPGWGGNDRREMTIKNKRQNLSTRTLFHHTSSSIAWPGAPAHSKHKHT